jgi:hypothetical protein
VADLAHVHLGAGALGFGLIASSSCAAGLEVHVIVGEGRSWPPSKTFELAVTHDVGELPAVEEYELAGLWKASDFAGLAPEACRVVCETPHLLITTSLKKGLDEVAPFILEIATARFAAGHALSTTFIAAENDPGPNFDDLRRELQKRAVRVCATVVNRLCSSRSTVNGRTRVGVDVEQEWVIELHQLPLPPPIVALATLPHVELTHDVHAIEIRKRWLINGTHLALAIIARRTRNLEEMHLAASDPGLVRWVDGLQRELTKVLREQNLDLGDDLDYGGRHFASVTRDHDDPVSRILSRFKRSNLMPFLEDFDRKLGQAMRAQFAADRKLSAPFREVLDALQTLLTRLEAFEDAEDLHDDDKELWLSDDIDKVVLDRYGELLTDYQGDEMAGFWQSAITKDWARQRRRLERRTYDRRKSPAERRPPVLEQRTGLERRRR